MFKIWDSMIMWKIRVMDVKTGRQDGNLSTGFCRGSKSASLHKMIFIPDGRVNKAGNKTELIANLCLCWSGLFKQKQISWISKYSPNTNLVTLTLHRCTAWDYQWKSCRNAQQFARYKKKSNQILRQTNKLTFTWQYYVNLNCL